MLELLLKGSTDSVSDDTEDDSGITFGGGRGRGRMLATIASGGSDSSPQDQSKLSSGRGTEPTVSLQAQSRRAGLLAKISELRPQEPAASLDRSMEQMSIADVSEATATKEPEVCVRRGKNGAPMSILTNYIRMKVDPERGVFEYEVRFNPQIHSSQLRYQLLNQHREIIGPTRTFDGAILFLPFKLPDPITKLASQNPNDETKVEISVIFKRKKKMSECIQLYGVLFERIMRVLQFIRFGRKNFDPSEPKVIPNHKLEIYPGYVTAVDEYEDGVMLCLDVTHRILCQKTVLEMMTQAYQASRGNIAEFQKNVLTALIGTVVITRYNNKTYRIDDVDFKLTPMSTFETKERVISYVEYYKSQYNIEIRDLKQPLLISRKEVRVSGEEEKRQLVFCIIPEISFFTGLTDEMENNMALKRDVASVTRITPNQRVQALEKYCARVNSMPETKQILANWGLSLDEKPLSLQARQMDEEKVFFGRGKSFPAGKNADFGRHATANELLEVVHLINWAVVHTQRDDAVTKKFIDCMHKNSRPMGLNVAAPQVSVVADDRTETYVQHLRRVLNKQLQIVVIICPSSRDDRYAAIKKTCCAEMPIPSQVINARTISNDAKNRAIVQKIALQMNCKLGGTLWSVRIPLESTMICGVDTFHEAKNKSNSVSALVASINPSFTRWYSRSIIQNKKEELIHGLIDSLKQSLRHFQKLNGSLPRKLIIFRDGVGDGQLKMCSEFELQQIISAMSSLEDGYAPNITMIVVQKRINTKIFAKFGDKIENPNPGCVVDHTITRRFLYDYFIVPQSVRQGTVTPTHYVVIHDSSNFPPDVLQRLTYKLCFMYYNWPGTVRVPACCQYAHKLATLVGQSIKREADESLADKLFFL